MDIVEVDNKLYDPYHILGVTKDDDNETVVYAFKKRVKKYHPDKVQEISQKKKYEKFFRILVASLEYIQNKRKDTIVSKHKPVISPPKHHIEPSSQSNPTDFGYGNYKRLSNIDEYKNNVPKIAAPIKDLKSNSKNFNNVFEYNKSLWNNESSNSGALIHRTTDGFYGFNAGDLDNCAIVSSFNGLLITGDDFGEEGLGYYGPNYSDYKHAYENAPNPNKTQINEGLSNPKKKLKSKEPLRTQGCTDLESIQELEPNGQETLAEASRKLYLRAVKQLKREVENDKNRVLKYKNMYDQQLVEQALDGQLECCPSLLDNLETHYKLLNFPPPTSKNDSG